MRAPQFKSHIIIVVIKIVVIENKEPWALLSNRKTARQSLLWLTRHRRHCSVFLPLCYLVSLIVTVTRASNCVIKRNASTSLGITLGTRAGFPERFSFVFLSMAPEEGRARVQPHLRREHGDGGQPHGGASPQALSHLLPAGAQPPSPTDASPPAPQPLRPPLSEEGPTPGPLHQAHRRSPQAAAAQAV